MEDYRKKILEGVLNHPTFKRASADLPADQKDRITKILEEFVDTFSMNLIRSFSVARSYQGGQKIPDNLSGSVITRENG